MRIGNNIRQVREERGYSQEYMATQLGISQGCYQKLETDKIKLKVDTLLQIAKVLNAEAGSLIGEPPPKALPDKSGQVRQTGSPTDVNLPAKGWERERELYEQLLQSKDRQLQLQQTLLARYEEENNRLKACQPPDHSTEPATLPDSLAPPCPPATDLESSNASD